MYKSCFCRATFPFSESDSIDSLGPGARAKREASTSFEEPRGLMMGWRFPPQFVYFGFAAEHTAKYVHVTISPRLIEYPPPHHRASCCQGRRRSGKSDLRGTLNHIEAL